MLKQRTKKELPSILFYHTLRLGLITFSRNVIKRAFENLNAKFTNLHPLPTRISESKKKVVRKRFSSLAVFCHIWLRSPINYLRHVIKVGKPDLIHCASQMLATGPWLVGGKTRLTVTIDTAIAEQVASGVKHSLFYRIITSHERKLLQSCERIYCTSRATREFLISDFNIDTEKAIYCPYAVDPIRGDRLEAGLQSRQRNRLPRLVFVGNDFARKGGDILVKLHQEYFIDKAELHVFSSEAPNLNSLQNVFQYRDIDNDVLVQEFLPTMDVFVLPTKFDQTPIAIIEAMAAHLPVVVSRTGGIEKMLENGVNGFLIEQDDTNALTERLTVLIEDASLRRRMGVESSLRFEASYNADLVYKELVEDLVFLASGGSKFSGVKKQQWVLGNNG